MPVGETGVIVDEVRGQLVRRDEVIMGEVYTLCVHATPSFYMPFGAPVSSAFLLVL